MWQRCSRKSSCREIQLEVQQMPKPFRTIPTADRQTLPQDEHSGSRQRRQPVAKAVELKSRNPSSQNCPRILHCWKSVRRSQLIVSVHVDTIRWMVAAAAAKSHFPTMPQRKPSQPLTMTCSTVPQHSRGGGRRRMATACTQHALRRNDWQKVEEAKCRKNVNRVGRI